MTALIIYMCIATANFSSPKAPVEKCCGKMMCGGQATNNSFIRPQSAVADHVWLSLLWPDWQSDFLQPPMTAMATMLWKVSLSMCIVQSMYSQATEVNTQLVSFHTPKDKLDLTSSCSVSLSANICLPESLCAFVHPSVCVDVIVSSTHLCLPPLNSQRPWCALLSRSSLSV